MGWQFGGRGLRGLRGWGLGDKVSWGTARGYKEELAKEMGSSAPPPPGKGFLIPPVRSTREEVSDYRLFLLLLHPQC